MIYITGDTHSDFTRFTEDQFPIQTEMTKNDYVIICGDFGGVWTFEEESSREKEVLDWLNNKNFTTLFVDGNHENFTRLYNDYPVEEWHGGKVHKIRDSVLHLMRGEIFDIDGKKIIIGMVQTFCSRVQRDDVNDFYIKIRDLGINFVLYDECHHSTSGPKYALSSLMINTKNIVGLSATPYHVGLQNFLMTGTVGQVISDTNSYEIKPTVNILKFHSRMDKKAISSVYRMSDMLKQRAKYNSLITDSATYRQLIVNLNTNLLQKGHRVINILFIGN